MVFLDCPAWLDQDGTVRCGLPAEVRWRYTMCSTGGPLESAMIRCPAGHWFNGPIEFLAWESSDKHPQGLAGAAAMPRGRHGRMAHRMVRHGRDSNEAQIIHSGATRLANPGSLAASISAARPALFQARSNYTASGEASASTGSPVRASADCLRIRRRLYNEGPTTRNSRDRSADSSLPANKGSDGHQGAVCFIVTN